MTTRFKWNTRLTRRFPCQIPIMGAPMADVSGGLLAAETCRAGALGFIAAGMNFKPIEEEVELFWDNKTRRSDQSRAKLSLGFIAHALQKDEESWQRFRDTLQRYQPAVVQFFAPDLSNTTKTMLDMVDMAKTECSALTMVQVSSTTETKSYLSKISEQGIIDALIVQGSEAGGHGARVELGNGTLPFASRVVSLVRRHPAHSDVTVLASGGIVNGRDVVACLALGCDGVSVGTRLWASKEALSHDSYKKRLASPDSDADDTVRSMTPDMIMNSYSNFPWPAPYDSIGMLRNQSTAKWDDRLKDLRTWLEADDEIQKQYQKAMKEGDYATSHIHSGQGVGEIDSIDGAFDIVERMDGEAQECLFNLQSAVSNR